MWESIHGFKYKLNHYKFKCAQIRVAVSDICQIYLFSILEDLNRCSDQAKLQYQKEDYEE